MSKVTVEIIQDFQGLGRAAKIVSSQFEVVASLDIGPRILHFSRKSGENILGEGVVLSENLPDGDEWKIYGGHRVWHSPEAFPRSYLGDNDPLESYEIFEDGMLFVQKEESWTKMQKSIRVTFKEDRILVTNRIHNKGAWPVDMAVWSLTIGSKGGREICPVVQRSTGLLPNANYVMWPYSRLDDRRVRWGQRYIVVDQDSIDSSAFKFGYPNEYGWIAYFNKDLCFIKKYKHQMGADYPDLGCSWETYSSDWGVELESLSPVQNVAPGLWIEHTDEWFLFEEVTMPLKDDDAIEKTLGRIAALAEIELPVPDTQGWSPQG